MAKKKGKGCLLFIGILVVLGIAVGAMGSKDKAPVENTTEQAAAIKVSATELINAYNANELKAKDTYEGKKVEVTGSVQSIAEAVGQKYVTLDNVDFVSVQCFFKEEAAKDLLDVNKGETITIIGTAGDKTGNVTVRDCKLIK